MKKTISSLTLFAFALIQISSAYGQWRETNYTGALRANMPYCSDQKDLERMVDYIIDGDDRQLNRIIDSGKCRVSGRDLQVQVFQHTDAYITFTTPSGNVFRTLKSFLK